MLELPKSSPAHSCLSHLPQDVAKTENHHKITDTIRRLFSSPVFLLALPTVSVCTFTAILLLTTSICLPIVLLAAAVALAIIGMEAVYLRKKLTYECSLIYTLLSVSMNSQKDKWWNEINENLVLGGIPLKNKDHIDQLIREAGISAVVSVIDDFEFTTQGFFSVPVTSQDWQNYGVHHDHIQASDFKPMSFETLDQVVEAIYNQVQSGKKVYVHCKAGRGRSAAGVIAYLVKHGPFTTFEAAHRFVKEKRTQINLNEKQAAAVISYLAKR